MTKANFRRTLVGAAVAAALGVLAVPASAAPYRGVFDPTDFEGEYIIDVDPACLTQVTGWYANEGICSATLTSAFADVVSSSPEPTYVGQLTFAPPAISSSSTLFGIYVYGGEIDSFDTALIPYFSASPSTTDSWWIEFISGQMPTPCDPYFCSTDFVPQGAPIPEKAVLLYSDQGVVATADYIGRAVAIPEPGTLALVLGALGGGWLARRRRKDKVPDSN